MVGSRPGRRFCTIKAGDPGHVRVCCDLSWPPPALLAICVALQRSAAQQQRGTAGQDVPAASPTGTRYHRVSVGPDSWSDTAGPATLGRLRERWRRNWDGPVDAINCCSTGRPTMNSHRVRSRAVSRVGPLGFCELVGIFCLAASWCSPRLVINRYR